uniref:Protein transport protein Sec24A n=1 Tax=Phallusia mammillata TaxID=59560 RepID=A0A6F9DR67_9ASCI|nr:protein transport protein Sec24A [Phallusia mammillata]
MGVIEKFLLCIRYLFLTFSGLLRRAACFVKKQKLDDESDPTSVVIVPNSQFPQPTNQTYDNGYTSNFPGSYPSPENPPQQATDLQMTDWNSWGTENAETDQQNPSEEIPAQNEADVDFFRDMEPTVKVNKVLVKKKRRNSSNSNRLAVNQDLEFTTTGQLDDWADENEQGGWDEEDTFDVDEAQVVREAREQRRLERQMRAKQQRQEKNLSRHNVQKLAQKVA